MAFRLPTFNLVCNIWLNAPNGVLPPAGPPSSSPACQLRIMKTGQTLGTAGANAFAYLAVPAHTDIRGVYGWNSLKPLPGHSHWAEVPAGSGRMYAILVVDDVGKGFPNEYREAILSQDDYIGPPPLP